MDQWMLVLSLTCVNVRLEGGAESITRRKKTLYIKSFLPNTSTTQVDQRIRVFYNYCTVVVVFKYKKIYFGYGNKMS